MSQWIRRGFTAAVLALSAVLVAAAPPATPPHELKAPVERRITVYAATQLHATEGVDTVDWSVKALRSEAAWAAGWTGRGVRVAVLDTGVMVAHRDLKDAVKKTKNFLGDGPADDDHGHGTHCAGSIAARRNGWGTVGVAPECELYCGKVLDGKGGGSYATVREAIVWATRECDVDVISLSLGGATGEATLRETLRDAAERGVIVVAAAGNETNDAPVSYPAAYLACLAVSAVDSDYKIADFSTTGGKVEAAGPGCNVTSCYPGGEEGMFAEASGTSMATPNVAGAAALWVQCDKAAGGERASRPRRFREWLAATAGDLGAKGRDDLYGYGLPDLSKLPAAKK